MEKKHKKTKTYLKRFWAIQDLSGYYLTGEGEVDKEIANSMEVKIQEVYKDDNEEIVGKTVYKNVKWLKGKKVYHPQDLYPEDDYDYYEENEEEAKEDPYKNITTG